MSRNKNKQSLAPGAVSTPPKVETSAAAPGAASTEQSAGEPETEPRVWPPVLRVASKGRSFRRAGLAFTQEPRDLDPAELTEEQIKALCEEPNLVCHWIDF